MIAAPICLIGACIALVVHTRLTEGCCPWQDVQFKDQFK